MADTQNFDKLNILKRRSIPYEEYFGDMDLSPKQKKDRKELALILEDYIMLFFSLIESGVSELTVCQEMTYELYKIIDDKDYFVDEQQLDRYVTETVKNTYRTTIDNIREHPNDVIPSADVTEEEIKDILAETGVVPEDKVTPYWTSDDRAKFIAENEANTLFNSKEFTDAIKADKKYKIWKTFADDKVRLTHVEVDVTMLPIDDYFSVGAARMLYPKDVTSPDSTGEDHLEEVINCRCHCLYI